MQLFGLFGNNVSESKSPRIHQLIWQYLGIEDNRYELFSQDVVPGREQLQQLAGANITIPFKEMVAVDVCSEEAAVIGAVNTVYWQNGQLCGANTDWIGVDKMMFAETDLSKVLIVGSGGAAKAVYYALVRRGVAEKNIVVAYRNNKLNDELVHIALSEISDKLDCFTTVFQTTPVNVVDVAELAGSTWYYDLRYTLRLARERAKNGLDMLIWQAIAVEALWLQQELLNDEQLFLYIKEQIEC